MKWSKTPVGATVDSLPDGATSETVDGVAYFVFAGTYYRPFYSGSNVIYMVVANPKSYSVFRSFWIIA